MRLLELMQPGCSPVAHPTVPSVDGKYAYAGLPDALKLLNPETGERILLLGNFVHWLTGLCGGDSRAIIHVFQSHIERPEPTVRRQWRVGDVALWANRATQHYGVDDSDDQTRTLRRVTIDGDVPVGVDGRRSALLSPESVPERSSLRTGRVGVSQEAEKFSVSALQDLSWKFLTNLVDVC